MNTRRQFLIGSASMGGSLVCTASWATQARKPVAAPALSPQTASMDKAVQMNAWLRISPDDTVWLAMPRSEMGQGIHLGLRMLVAEELGCRLESIRLEDPDIAADFANQAALAETVPFRPDDEGMVANSARSVMRKAARILDMQITGGSTSTIDAWQQLRAIAAATRQQLEAVAAQTWGVDAATVSLNAGLIAGPKDSQRMRMGLAVPAASQMRLSGQIRLRDAAAYRVIGSRPQRTDLIGRVDGSAVFGADVRLPGQLYGVPRFCPVFGGTVKALRNRDALLAMPNVVDVLVVPALTSSGGIVVVANGFWAASQAAKAAEIEWFTPPQSAMMDSSKIAGQLEQALTTGRVHWTYWRRGDDGWSTSSDTPAQVRSVYRAPFLAHATLEPMNATAWLRNGQLDVWAPTQGQGPARAKAAQVASLSTDAVRIHTTLLGGGFGRRVESDFVALATHVACQMPGRPVQVLWPREEDMTHDYYRPAAAAALSARVAADGRITHWHHRTASGSVSHQAFQRVGLPGVGPDKAVAEGAFDHAYAADHLRVDHVLKDSGIPLGYWRSVGHSYQAFFVESFIDELAFRAGMDPMQFRLLNLPADSRQARVLKAACEMAGYRPALAAASVQTQEQTALGMAVHLSFGSVVAQVVQVRRSTDGVRIERVWCAVDCGLAIHPDGVIQQMEGGIVFGLTAALHGQIDIDAGAVRQRNFGDYPLLTLQQTPSIDVTILPSAAAPSGVGEIAVPPIAPALANALFRLTGQRQRSLPLKM